MTATETSPFTVESRCSTRSAMGIMATEQRPQVGQEVSVAPPNLRPSDLSSSRATLTSSTGSAVSEMRMVSPMPSASRMPRPALLFTVPASSVPASVTPRWSG
jgi:hypothetical protein